MNEQRIKARVAGRAAALELLPLLEWEDGTGADYAEALIDALRECLPKRREPPPPPPMPLARLRAERMPFGFYKGKRFDEVPTEYLDTLAALQEDFYPTLRAYLKHPERW